MSSSRIINADTTLQIVSYNQLLFIANAAITQNLAFNNIAPVPELVDNFETLLEPHRDKPYNEDIKTLINTRPKFSSSSTQMEVNKKMREWQWWFVKEKHKALMRLANRAHLLPIKGAPNTQEL